jgi:hypothetical protein
LLGHVVRQLRQRHFAAQNTFVEVEHDLLTASITDRRDHRCERNNPRWQEISTEYGVHQCRFAAAESPDNQQVEPVFSQAREKIPAFGLQGFVLCIDSLGGTDDVGYPEFLLLVLFEVHERHFSLIEVLTAL